MVNGEFSPKFTPDTTHLIVRVDENNKADKTFKYLCAVAAGKWVVSYAWVQKCLDAKKLVPEVWKFLFWKVSNYMHGAALKTCLCHY